MRLSVFVLSLAISIPASASRATDFLKWLTDTKRVACAEFLTVPPAQPAAPASQPLSSKVPSRYPDFHVDWNAFIANQKRLGVSEGEIQAKLPHGEFSTPKTLKRFRDATGNENWFFGDAIPDEAYINLVKSVSGYEIVQVGYWILLPNFDYMKFAQAISSGYDWTKEILSWSHVISKDPRWTDILFAAWVGRRNLSSAVLILNYVSEKEQQILGRKMKDEMARTQSNYSSDQRHRWLLEMRHSIPPEFIPDELAAEADKWAKLDQYPALQLNSIQPCAEGSYGAGTCQYLTHGHLNSLDFSLFRSSKYRDNVLIWVQGHLVGSIKLTGDQSMVALRNVVDDRGRLVLAMGATYELPMDLVQGLKGSKKNDKWRSVSLNSLKVTSHSQLPNENAWSQLNYLDLLALMEQDFSTGDSDNNLTWRESIEEFKRDPNLAIHKAMESKVRSVVYRRMNNFRIYMEKHNTAPAPAQQ